MVLNMHIPKNGAGSMNVNCESSGASRQPQGNGDDNNEDFSEYLWMEDMESFDKQVLAELEEEDEIEKCMEEMLAEEEARDTIYYSIPNAPPPSALPLYAANDSWNQVTNNALNHLNQQGLVGRPLAPDEVEFGPSGDAFPAAMYAPPNYIPHYEYAAARSASQPLEQQRPATFTNYDDLIHNISSLAVSDGPGILATSKLNPDAAEFVPGRLAQASDGGEASDSSEASDR